MSPKDSNIKLTKAESDISIPEVVNISGFIYSDGRPDIFNDAAIEELKSSESKQTPNISVIQYPSGIKLVLIVFSLNLGLFCVGLDNTILSSAIPKITDRFHTLNDVGWYASSYLLTVCSFQLSWGKLYTFYSVKWTYLASVFIFEIGSIIAGTAPSSSALIVGRAVSGIGSGGIATGAYNIIAISTPPHHRPTLIGMMGSMYGFACIAGPLMGGAFTDNSHLTWRWCFYINLPLGLLTSVCIAIFVKNDSVNKTDKLGIIQNLKQMDLFGLFILVPGVVCLLLALQWGGTKYTWKDGRTIALFLLAGFLFICFLGIQVLSGEKATVPPRVFKNRNIWGSALYGSCVTASFFLMVYYIPIWFQAITSASAIRSGVMNIPMVLSFVVSSLICGALTTVTGHYVPFVYLAVFSLSIGSGLLTTLNVNSGPGEWIGYQILFGAGVGFGLPTALTAPQTALALADVPIGTACIMFFENLIAAIFVSVGQNVFTNQLLDNIKKFIPSVDGKAILDAGALEIKELVPQDFYEEVLLAYNQSLTHTFYVAMVLSCCSILGAISLQWLSVKAKKNEISEEGISVDNFHMTER